MRRLFWLFIPLVVVVVMCFQWSMFYLSGILNIPAWYRFCVGYLGVIFGKGANVLDVSVCQG